jgi:hypothetical protein
MAQKRPPRDHQPKLDEHVLVGTTSEEGKSRKEDLASLTDEQCMIATPWLRGMDLKTKEWGMFFVDELHDIVWNEKAFDNLVLPEEDKALTWDFVEAKRLSNSTYDDFIADKGTLHLLLIPSLTEIGRGTIILMFGKPGVGKTFTAEAGSYPHLLRHAPNVSSGRKVARPAVLHVGRRPRHGGPRR